MRKKGLLKKKNCRRLLLIWLIRQDWKRLRRSEKAVESGSVGSTSTPAKEPTKDVTKEETPAKNTAPQKKPDQETEDDVDKSEPMPKKDVSDEKTEDDKAEVGSVPENATSAEEKALMQMLVAQQLLEPVNAAVPLEPNAAVRLVPNAAVPLEFQTQQYRW